MQQGWASSLGGVAMASGHPPHLKSTLVHPQLKLLLAARVVNAVGQGSGTVLGVRGRGSQHSQPPKGARVMQSSCASRAACACSTTRAAAPHPLTWLHCTGCT